MQDDPILELSTQVVPTKKLLVDDVEYEMFTPAHIGADEEAKLMALFSRHGRAMARYDKAANDDQAEKSAAEIRRTRTELIAKFTTIPREVAEKLPLPAQVQLITYFNDEMKAAGLSGGTEEEATEE